MELTIKTDHLSYNQVLGIIEHLAPWMAQVRFKWMHNARFIGEDMGMDMHIDDLTTYPELDTTSYGGRTTYGFRLPAKFFVSIEGHLFFESQPGAAEMVTGNYRARILQRVKRDDLQALMDEVMAHIPVTP